MEKQKLQTKNSNELSLSFDFQILNYEFRQIDIKINGLLTKLDYNPNYFYWFVEDLILFLAKNRYALRWDYEKVKIFNLEVLQLGENLNDFKKKFSSITNFDLEYN
ncbi:hypothetical protein [Mycoplasma sp. 'Moose RK']|uniref:hypothetical protein n=1 Tax=Mycoplasma sp. 'Moose RK' TaxID=2780095 RepID=UPI0018C22216|nr:hypothetical protein [Mycoplasma sp. 'Moose RK']MBG0730990.1 hypothetical protein [Mycoplasma sp. 'Moose RK']